MTSSEAAIGLVFISSKYRLIFDRNFIKIGAISLLILAIAVENGLGDQCSEFAEEIKGRKQDVSRPIAKRILQLILNLAPTYP